MLKTHIIRHDRRQGIVLLVVMAMLALFATVALSFVYYAESEATSMHYASQAQTQAQADADPEMLLSYFLSQLIYDTDNVSSAMRGHSLARTMYGLSPYDYNVIPFSGMGRLHSNTTASAPKTDNTNLVNFQYYPSDPFIRYPEIVDDLIATNPSKGNPQGQSILNPGMPLDSKKNRYVGGNVPWTYPDVNNMFLAAVDGKGRVLIPSFQRPWTIDNVSQSGVDPSWLKYATMRPQFGAQLQPPDNDTPANPDKGCDVKNLDNSLGRLLSDGTYANNDSIWMDLGFGTMVAPNGKKYKPLFAPLIVDLDNK
jgi:hypothetical protein